jgi:hypothetical protein
VSKKTVKLLLIFFLLVALTKEPTRMADAVQQAWDGIFGGAGSLMGGFFTFVDNLSK